MFKSIHSTFGIFLLTLVLCACDENTTSEKRKVSFAPDSQALAANEVRHLFSDAHAADRFQLILTGASVLSGTVSFNIITARGDTIHKESFPSTYLLGYALDDTATPAIKEAFIKRRIDNFFASTQFLSPAIKPGELFDEDYSDKSIWKEISSEKTTVGFEYLIGEEDNRRIAYSRRLKKVVMYFNCC